MKVITDSTGTFEVQLDTGTYSLIFPEKHQSFTKYLESVTVESQYLKPGRESCFATWWETPDARFPVSDSTKQVTCILKRTCYTEYNPCMIYTGPLRR
ncbi:MAG: hypothetical protein HKN76_08105 [Saprospiraceae bacterium]|nr:hypothetical protein [Saprospiraceae bacterium]